MNNAREAANPNPNPNPNQGRTEAVVHAKEAALGHGLGEAVEEAGELRVAGADVLVRVGVTVRVRVGVRGGVRVKVRVRVGVGLGLGSGRVRSEESGLVEVSRGLVRASGFVRISLPRRDGYGRSRGVDAIVSRLGDVGRYREM